jgi:hypothetical protein
MSFEQHPFEWKYGKDSNNLSSITLYPFSMADQTEATDIIAEAIKSMTAEENMTLTELDLVRKIMDVIASNFLRMVKLASSDTVSEEDLAALPRKVTNMQMMTFAEYVWNTNYGDVKKNFTNLVTGVRTVLLNRK